MSVFAKIAKRKKANESMTNEDIKHIDSSLLKELNTIQSDVEKVIAYSQNMPYAKADKLIQNWFRAKGALIDNVLQHGLIVETDEIVTFTLGKKEADYKFNDFINEVECRWNSWEAAQFLREVSCQEFFDNKLNKDYKTSTEEKIQEGTKVVKALKHFVQNKDLLTDIQNAASMLIQENKISGRLCFSVHPLDFLSLSENNYKWRSCHALDGDYRGGNLSYMMDSSTIICYLKSENDNNKEHLKAFPDDVLWNSKKWRMLLFFSNDMNMLFAGRQYPFFAEGALDTITKYLDALMNNTEFTKWHHQKISSFEDTDTRSLFTFNGRRYLPVGDKLKSMGTLVKDNPHSLQFNDLLFSSCYDPYYCYRNTGSHGWLYLSRVTGLTDQNTRFNIGGEVLCTKCEHNIIESHESLMCDHCAYECGSDDDDYCYCSCCNCREHIDNICYVNGDPVCVECMETEVEQCQHCGEYVFKEDIVYYNGQYICKCCKENLEENSR